MPSGRHDSLDAQTTLRFRHDTCPALGVLDVSDGRKENSRPKSHENAASDPNLGADFRRDLRPVGGLCLSGYQHGRLETHVTKRRSKRVEVSPVSRKS